MILDRSDYTHKMMKILKDDKYTVKKRDPTVKKEKEIANALKRLCNEGHLDVRLCDLLTPRYSSAPQMYGLPKVHKEDIPMRPIVSAIGSPSYSLAKELARILTPMAGNTPHTVKNSSTFVDIIRDLELEPEDRLVSFDVTNLFPQVPIDEALRVIEERLKADSSLSERTTIPIPQLMELTELCLRTTYFQFQDTFFEQSDGAAMGSPLSPIVANLYMEHLEEIALQTAPSPPRLWLRYVDDTFVIWTHGQNELERFHEHLNSQHPNIQFTVELEEEGRLAFLDVQVSRHDTRLSTAVYRKPTHTDRYIPFHSHHHPRTVTGVLRGMRDRAHRICDSTSKQQELQHLQDVFQANGFPKSLVKKTLSQHGPPPTTEVTNDDSPPNDDAEKLSTATHNGTLPTDSHTQEASSTDTDNVDPPEDDAPKSPSTNPSDEDPPPMEDDAPKIICLPYVKGISEKIERICTPLGVKAAFRPVRTIRKTLMKVKTPIPEAKKKSVVYEVPCKECDGVYIGETKRTLKIRLGEHKSAVKRGDPKNGIAVHAHETKHAINWDEAKVRRCVNGFWQRKTTEAIHIQRNKKTMNLDRGLCLPSMWNPILNPQ